MNTLTDKVAQAAGITPQQADKAIETVTAALKEKLPYLMHQQIDILIGGGTISDGIKAKMETLKEDVEASAKDIGSRAQEFGEEVGKKINDLFSAKK
jgi:ferritin-like protein